MLHVFGHVWASKFCCRTGCMNLAAQCRTAFSVSTSLQHMFCSRWLLGTGPSPSCLYIFLHARTLVTTFRLTRLSSVYISIYIYIFISLPMHISFINTFIYIYLFDVYVNIGWLDRLIGKKIDTHICPHRLWRCLPDVIPTGFWDAVGRTGLMKKSRNMSLRLGS